MSHTPGPWTFVPRHIAESEPEVRAPEGWLICCIASDDDAQAIAAVPEMIAVLKQINSEMAAGLGSAYGETRESVRRVLKKAGAL